MENDFVDQIRQFYEAERQRLYVYALSLTRNRELAEDAIHSAFASVLKRGQAPLELRPYVYRSVRNAAFDALKASSNGHLDESVIVAEDTVDPSVPILLQEALAELAESERETIVMKTYSGMTLREIAETQQVSINTAASWYRRGLEKLRRILEEVPHERH